MVMNLVVVMEDPCQGGYIAALTGNIMFLEGWGETPEEAKEDLLNTVQDAGIVTWLYSEDDGFPDLVSA